MAADETLAARGITCGGSGGNTIRIRYYDRTGTRILGTSPKLYGRFSSLWVTAIMWENAPTPAS